VPLSQVAVAVPVRVLSAGLLLWVPPWLAAVTVALQA